MYFNIVAHLVGIDGVDKRVDAIAMTITGGLTIDDLSLAQLSYSPPFGSARDVVNVAGMASRNARVSTLCEIVPLSV
jgi:hypothetical protein